VLFVDSRELQLLVESDDADGDELPVGVATATDWRRRLQVAGEEPDKLHRLPQCSPQPGAAGSKG
jgi:hypothetical protein